MLGLKGVIERKRWLKGKLEKETKAQRRAQKDARAQRRARNEARAQRRARKRWGLKGALEKRGRVRKHTTLDGKWKVVEKYRNFSGGLIFMGGLLRLKNSQKWNIFKSNFNLGHFKLAFHLMDSVIIFSNEICKTHCPMSQSLDNMHISLPDLKYRPPFLLSLLVAWLIRTCYLWFGSSLSFGF